MECFNLSGTLSPGSIDTNFEERLHSAWSSKVEVLEALNELVSDRESCLIVYFSSLTSHFGGVGIGAHAVANSYLDASCELQNLKTGHRVYSLGWSLWNGIGQSKDQTDADIARTHGYAPLLAEEGLSLMESVLNNTPGCYLVGILPNAPGVSWRVLPVQIYRSTQLTKPSLTDKIPLGISKQVYETNLIVSQRTHSLEFEVSTPETIEYSLSKIWCSILELDAVSRAENFFDLGGSSLLVPLLTDRIALEFHVDVKPVNIFRYTTIQKLSAHIYDLLQTR